MNQRALAAEAIGTFMLTASVLGAAFYSFPNAGIIGVALSIGLTVMAMAYSIGHISGGHYNPAVTAGLVAAGRFPAGDAIGYIVAQCIGAVAACGLFTLIGNTGASYAANFVQKGFSVCSVFIIEMMLTAFFLIVIVGATSKRAPAGFAPIAIGLALTVIHLMSIPVSNTSVNPARSLGPALFSKEGAALAQLWIFWVAPILGAVVGGSIAKWLQNE